VIERDADGGRERGQRGTEKTPYPIGGLLNPGSAIFIAGLRRLGHPFFFFFFSRFLWSTHFWGERVFGADLLPKLLIYDRGEARNWKDRGRPVLSYGLDEVESRWW
jgi:hypothetical protein